MGGGPAYMLEVPGKMNWIYGYDFTEGDRPVPARRRFSDPHALYALFDEFRRRDVMDVERRVKIRNIYNGFLPYNPADLRAAGQAWRTNMNFHGLSNAIDARAEAVDHLAVDTCSLVTLANVAPETAGPDDERITATVEEEFSRALREDGRVIPAFSAMMKEADLYGLGPVTWRTPDDYVPVALERSQVKFDPEGPVVSSDHDVIMVETTLPADYLFRLLDNQEFAAKAGWNVEAVKRWVVMAFHDRIDSRSTMAAAGGVTPQEAALEAMRRNDFYESVQFEKLNVIFAYVREMQAPRKITWIIAPASSQRIQGSDPLKEFLFVQENAYDTMDQVFVWHAASSSKRYARSVRGIASTLAPIAMTEDRLTCAMVDSTMRAMSMVLKQKNPGATPSVTLQELGPYTVVGSDLDPVPNANQMSNFQGAMQVRQMLSQLGAGSVAGTEMGATFPRLQEGGTSATKAESEIMEHRRTMRDENLSAVRLYAWDRILAETARRFFRIAVGNRAVLEEYPHVRRFVDRCERRGVTTDVLREVLDRFVVQTNRDIVIGAEGIIQFLSTVQAQFSGNTDEAGRKAMSHDIVRRRLGARYANRYFPEKSRDEGPSNNASIATLENNALQARQPVLVGPDQDHYAHILVHMQVLDQIKKTVQEGLATAQQKSQEEGGVTQNAQGELAPQVEDPESLAAVLEATSQHVQQHLALFSTQIGVKDKAKQIQGVITGLADTIKALNLAIAEQRRVKEAEMEKRQREMEELQRQADEAEIAKANHKADLDAQNARYKIDLDHQVAMERVRLESEQGRARLQMEDRDRREKGRIDYETARNSAMIESERARRDMDIRTSEAQHGMRMAEATAANDARLKMGELAADRVANSRRTASVTGRAAPQPADLINPGADGIIPL